MACPEAGPVDWAPRAERPAGAGPDVPSRSVGLVGAGRAGGAVAAALAAAGRPVVAVVTRSEDARRRAEAGFPTARTGSPTAVADALHAADTLLVAVPDDAIAEVIGQLVAVRAVRAGQLVAHLSGRHGLDVLAAAGAAGATRAAIHPIMTLPGGAPDPRVFLGVSFGITADDDAAARARDVVTAIGGVPLMVADDRRALYHAALVLGGNFLASLTLAARAALTAAGVADPGSALAPLLRASLDNALADGWPAATGPVRRGDVGTVRAHLDALGPVDPVIAEVYRVLGRYTAGELAAAELLEPAASARLTVELANPAPTVGSGGAVV